VARATWGSTDLGGTIGVLSAGTKLRVAHWPGAADGRGTVIIATGRAEFIECYGESIADLRRLGYAVVAFDFRGQGGSDRRTARTGHIDSFSQYADDIAAVVRHASELGLPQPFTVLAHSMGGLAALVAQPQLVGEVERMVLLAPMLKIADLPMPPALAGLIAGAATLVGMGRRAAAKDPPPASPQNFPRNKLTSDPQRYARICALMNADPDLTIGAPTYGWIKAAVGAMRRVERSKGELLPMPTLFIASGADRIVSTPAIEAFARETPGGGLVRIKGARHQLLLERDELRALFFAAFGAFLAERPAVTAKVPRRGRKLKFVAGAVSDPAQVFTGWQQLDEESAPSSPAAAADDAAPLPEPRVRAPLTAIAPAPAAPADKAPPNGATPSPAEPDAAPEAASPSPDADRTRRRRAGRRVEPPLERVAPTVVSPSPATVAAVAPTATTAAPPYTAAEGPFQAEDPQEADFTERASVGVASVPADALDDDAPDGDPPAAAMATGVEIEPITARVDLAEEAWLGEVDDDTDVLLNPTAAAARVAAAAEADEPPAGPDTTPEDAPHRRRHGDGEGRRMGPLGVRRRERLDGRGEDGAERPRGGPLLRRRRRDRDETDGERPRRMRGDGPADREHVGEAPPRAAGPLRPVPDGRQQRRPHPEGTAPMPEDGDGAARPGPRLRNRLRRGGPRGGEPAGTDHAATAIDAPDGPRWVHDPAAAASDGGPDWTVDPAASEPGETVSDGQADGSAGEPERRPVAPSPGRRGLLGTPRPRRR